MLLVSFLWKKLYPAYCIDFWLTIRLLCATLRVYVVKVLFSTSTTDSSTMHVVVFDFGTNLSPHFGSWNTNTLDMHTGFHQQKCLCLISDQGVAPQRSVCNSWTTVRIESYFTLFVFTMKRMECSWLSLVTLLWTVSSTNTCLLWRMKEIHVHVQPETFYNTVF